MLVDGRHPLRGRSVRGASSPLARLRPTVWTARPVLAAYLAEARALAARGGGTLWVVEPRLPADRVPAFAARVEAHLRAHGVRTGGVTPIPGSTSARVRVSAA